MLKSNEIMSKWRFAEKYKHTDVVLYFVNKSRFTATLPKYWQHELVAPKNFRCFDCTHYIFIILYESRGS